MSQASKDVRWLHISDFHFQGSGSYDRDVVLRALDNSVEKLAERFGHPDLIFATGDIANTGQASEYQHASSFFEKLLKRFDLPKERLFVVPGNHDVNRMAGRGLFRTISDPQKVDAYFDPSDDLPHVQRQSAYAAWYNEFFSGIRSFSASSSVSTPEILNINETKIRIVPINSAIFSYGDDDHGKLWLGRRCIDDADLSRDEFDISIALMHHPLSWLNSSEQSSIKLAIRKTFDVLLSGHLHDTDVENVLGLEGSTCLHLAAGATYQTRKWPNTAMFATLSNNQVRINPIRFEDTPQPIWTVDTSIFPNSQDFSHVYNIASKRGITLVPPTDNTALDSPPSDHATSIVKSEFEQDLFMTPAGLHLYVEPTLMTKAQDGTADNDADRVTISTIISSPSSFFIESRSEYGSSTLCKRLAYEHSMYGQGPVLRRDATALPNYKKKLESSFPIEIQHAESSSVLILDNFNADKHERLLNELSATGWFKKFVVVSVNRGVHSIKIVDTSSLPQKFERLFLWSISRSDVREMAGTLFHSNDAAYVSDIVDKVYSDLLALCIPLTPANVIMYLRILNREGEFHPINRVDILARYLDEILRRPGDGYTDSFNVKNKLDVISFVVFKLYNSRSGQMDDRIWFELTREYQSTTLSEFDAASFLSELIDCRVFVRHGGLIYLKYSFFYSFFLGRYFSGRSEALKAFLDSDGYLEIPQIIDVITGLSADNTSIIERLTDKLSSHLRDFSTQFISREFDPLSEALWPDSESDDETIWKPIAAKIEAGPRSAAEIDLLKSSITAEARTSDQVVVFNKFFELENSLFAVLGCLSDGIKNSDDIDGAVKLRAVDALLSAHLVSFQIGTVFSSIIGKSPVFQWGGVAFVDFHKVERPEENKSASMFAVVDALNFTIASSAAEVLGSRKLGGVFKAQESRLEGSSFTSLINFACVLNSKPNDWEKVLSKSIDRTDKNAFYLNTMLSLLLCALENEIMQVGDRERIKKLVAHIRTKRSLGRQAPGSKAVSRMLAHLESIGHFAKDKDQSSA